VTDTRYKMERRKPMKNPYALDLDRHAAGPLDRGLGQRGRLARFAQHALVVGLLVVFATNARAQDTDEPSLGFDINRVVADAHQTQQDEANDAGPLPFGRVGSTRFTLVSGIATNGSGGSDVQPIAFAYSSFIDDDVELLAEVGTWYFDQEGDNAAGGSFSLGARWHAISHPRWSLFVDVGLGMLAATDNVPEGGTSFDFLPRLGAGGTFAIGDTNSRAVIGLRWHHISNARIFGDLSNPARNAPMFYVGVSFPL
jgi:lipid A 3-O-deacylase